MDAKSLSNADLADALCTAKLAPAKYLDSEDLHFHKSVIDEAAKRLKDPLQRCSYNHACDSLKERIAARTNEIALLNRKLAVAVDALNEVASLDCQATCTVLARGGASDCLACNKMHANGALDQIREMT